jgi:hypothetical protein
MTKEKTPGSARILLIAAGVGVFIAGYIYFLFLQLGPLNNLLQSKRQVDFFQNIIVHQIDAHVVTGKPLSPQQQAISKKIINRGQWGYDCCSNIPTMRSAGFSAANDFQIANKIPSLYLQLAVDESWINLLHRVCTISLVWQLPGRYEAGSYVFLPYYEKSWIQPNNKIMNKNSQLPLLLPYISPFLHGLEGYSTRLIIINPSIYLFLFLYNTFFATYRLWNPR